MSKIYDNWERLVAAVLRREQLWQLCHQNSISSSLTSSSSSFSSVGFGSSSSFSSPSRHELGHSLPFHELAHINISASVHREPNRLVFTDTSPFTFDVETLLHAPSVNLGEGIQKFGESFVVIPVKYLMVVVRRLIKGDIPSKDLKQQTGNMTRIQRPINNMIGSIEHENLVKLRGYYLYGGPYGLLSFGIYDYFSEGSVSSMLYGKRDPRRVQLDWETRIKIAKGLARGLAHIHKQCGGKLVHGNIKASNVFINSQGYGCLSDLNLRNLLNPDEPTVINLDGYNPPEVKKNRVSQACDVYSFGVFLLELVTGKSPIRSGAKRYCHWARFNAQDEWTVMVFDREILKISTMKDEMMDVLNVGLYCVLDDPDKRPNMERVVEMLESCDTDNSLRLR